MNQILVTEKLYITPELKKKKKLYRFEFFISTFLVCLLFSYYIYAEYDKVKSEEVSKDILSNVDIVEEEENIVDESENNALIVILDEDKNVSPNEQVQEEISNNIEQTKEQTNDTEILTAKSGQQYSIVAVINIPKIDVNYPILSITTDELLKISPTKFFGPEANEVGNYCIVGHNYRNKRFFSKVPTLVNGDIIELTNYKTKETLKYVVYDKYIVDPEDTSCTTQKTNGKKEITLITCTNDSKRRYIIKATEVL